MPSLAVSLGLAFFAILYVLAIGPYWKISPDSTSYVSAGASLASGNGYRKAGEPVLLYPPVTSLMFCIPMLLFPGSYLALNALVTMFALLAHAACLVLLKIEVDGIRAAIPVVLSLGSTLIFHHSTRLLSDIFYLFFSMWSLVVAERISTKDSGWRQHLLLAAIVWVACMTRIAGLILVAAIVVHTLASPYKRGRRSLLACLFVVALTVALWEGRNLSLGASYLKLTLQNDPWVDEAGYTSVLGLLHKFYHNLDDYASIGDILTNNAILAFPSSWGCVGLLVRGTALAVFCLGLVHSLRHRLTVTNVYCAIYLLVLGVYYPYIEERFLLPIVPMLFHYALLGADAMVEAARVRLGPTVPRVACAALLAYAALYLSAGVYEMLWSIPREHTSPFGDYPIKYSQNDDLQRLALWVRDHSAPGERFLSQHADVVEYLTEREGYYAPFSTDPDKLLELLESRQVRYVLADKQKPKVQQFLIPAIQAHPGRFHLLQDADNASLYEFTLQP